MDETLRKEIEEIVDERLSNLLKGAGKIVKNSKKKKRAYK